MTILLQPELESSLDQPLGALLSSHHDDEEVKDMHPAHLALNQRHQILEEMR